jgi:hypothetical protein
MFGKDSDKFYNKRTKRRCDIENMINIIDACIIRLRRGDIQSIPTQKYLLKNCSVNIKSLFIILNDNKDTIYNYDSLMAETRYVDKWTKTLIYQYNVK